MKKGKKAKTNDIESIDFGKLKMVDKKIDFSKMKIVSAPTKKAGMYSEQVQILLDAMEHPEAYVTDESRFYDFIMSKKTLTTLSQELGIKIADTDLLVDIAEKIKRRNKIH